MTRSKARWSVRQPIQQAPEKRSSLELSQEDSADIALLHELRNDFAHFTPKGCSIDLEGLPRIVDKTLGLVEVLMQTDRVSYRMTGNKKRRIRDGVRTVRTVLGVAT